MMKRLLFEKKVDKLGRLVVPHALRQLYGIESGDALQVTVVENGILLTPVGDTNEAV